MFCDLSFRTGGVVLGGVALSSFLSFILLDERWCCGVQSFKARRRLGRGRGKRSGFLRSGRDDSFGRGEENRQRERHGRILAERYGWICVVEFFGILHSAQDDVKNR